MKALKNKNRLSRRRAMIVLVIVSSAFIVFAASALAVAPRGDANYIAVDKVGRPYITLWMQTRTRMVIFACYNWGKVDHGDHYNNVKPITVNASGWFSYNGLGTNLKGVTAPLKLSGHFISKTEAVGTLSAPCMKNYKFDARFG